jgi:hypothetical protein
VSLETGAVLSMLIPPTVLPGVELPAMSFAPALVTLRFAPSSVMSMSDGQLATPEPAFRSASTGSLQLKPTATRPLYQPSAFGCVVGPPVIVGPRRSMLTPLTDAEFEFPALSDTFTGPAPRFRPSPMIVVLAGHNPSTPESPSEQFQVTETSPVYHLFPLASMPFGSGSCPLMSGGVRSMLMFLTVASAVLPALSAAFPVTDWPAPSLVSVTGCVQPAMPDSASLQVNMAVTGTLFQPLAFASGVRSPVIVGATLSICTVIEFCGAPLSSTLPA